MNIHSLTPIYLLIIFNTYRILSVLPFFFFFGIINVYVGIFSAVAFRLYDLRQTGYIEREEVGVATILILVNSMLPLSVVTSIKSHPNKKERKGTLILL